MNIHGKELESHDCDNIIYYDNILIKSRQQKLNEFLSFDDFVNYITNNPDFCGCQYHVSMKGHCEKNNGSNK